ncbi:MAG: hypothetical protein DHS20C16_03130 [Phycisphaerae bacterium]|nr:MAG: hypothetical protein DHS20C16_03130 [Phycisphaerae bacterium]
MICSGDSNGSLDDRLQSLAYQIVSIDPDDSLAHVLMTDGLMLNIDRETGWFEIVDTSELITQGQLDSFGDSDSRSVTVDFYASDGSSVSGSLHAIVTPGLQSSEVILQMTTAEQVVDASIVINSLHTAFDPQNTATAQLEQREALVAPQLLNGMIPETNMLSGEAILLSVLAAMQDVSISYEPKADAHKTALLQRLDQLGFGAQTAMSDGSESDCLDDCNETWDPIIQQELDERANAIASAQDIRDAAQAAYQSKVDSLRASLRGCLDGVRSDFLLQSTVEIGVGVTGTTVGVIVAGGATGGTAAIGAGVVGTTATTSALITSALIADSHGNACVDDFRFALDRAKTDRDTHFETADAIVQQAENDVDDAVNNLEECSLECEDDEIPTPQ